MNRKVLKASAGTGKTYRLAVEYICSLLNGENYEEILVMTFTKKATSEIKNRIFEHINNIINNTKDGQKILETIKKHYKNIKIDNEKLSKIYFEMLKNKEKVKVYTIDGFTNMIFKKTIAPYLNIYNYEIISDYKNKELIEKVLEKIISEKEYFSKLKYFFENNMEKDIQKYFEYIKAFADERWKFALLKRENKKKFGDIDFFIAIEEINIRLKEIAEIKKDIESYPKDYYKKSFYDYCEIETIENKKKYIIENYEMFLKETIWNGNKTKGKIVENIKNDMLNIYEEFLKKLSKYIYNEKMIEMENMIFDFAETVFHIYDNFKISEKKFTHTDMSNYTYSYLYKKELKLFEKENLSDYFYELLDAKINTVFIDEFQDTSILQWKILNPLIKNAENVICVGDEKQSIYGWRGGEKKLFENLPDIIKADVEKMDTSYRSSEGIINFVNEIFCDIDEEWDYDKVNSIKKGGYINAVISTKDTEENIIDTIIDDIKEKIKNYKNTAIIARKKSYLFQIAQKLDEKGIDYIINDGENITKHNAVKGLYFLLRYTAYRDFFDLLRYLRSDAVKINEKILKNILKNQKIIEKYILEKNTNFTLPKKLNSIKNLFDFIKILIKNYENNYIFSENKEDEKKKKIIENISKQFFWKYGINNMFKTPNDIKNLYNFLLKFTKYDNLDTFMEFVEESIEDNLMIQESVADKNAINLMTIHKSKGLEFENEILYWETSKTLRDRDYFKFYVKMNENYSEISDYLFTIEKYKKVIEGCNFEFEKNEIEKRKQEEINNLYVALTRPKNNLFIYAVSNKKEEKLEQTEDILVKSLMKIMNFEKYEDNENNENDENNEKISKNIEQGIFYEESEQTEKKVSKKIEFENKYLTDTTYDMEELSKIKASKIDENGFKYSLKLETARKEGIMIHYYMEFLKYNTSEERNLARNLVLNKYGNMFGQKRIAAILERIDKAIFENLEIFDKKWEIYNEYEIEIVENKEKIRIDRLCIDRNEKIILIVDYKTGYTREKMQLEDYKKAVKNIIGNEYKIFTKFLEI